MKPTGFHDETGREICAGDVLEMTNEPPIGRKGDRVRVAWKSVRGEDYWGAINIAPTPAWRTEISWPLTNGNKIISR